MRTRFVAFLALIFFILVSIGCATKKHVRNRINERVTPLEARTGELEETSRRNSQEIGRLSSEINDVRSSVGRAQSQADAALARADEANTRVTRSEQSVNQLKTNLDRFTLQNTATVNFKFNSHQIEPEARASLDALASQIKDRENFILEIQGFTDALGTDRYNNELAERRADAVRRYLAEFHNIPLFRMHMLGLGEVRAVADNDTQEGRAQNRRVEIRLLTRSVTVGSTATTSGAQH